MRQSLIIACLLMAGCVPKNATKPELKHLRFQIIEENVFGLYGFIHFRDIKTGNEYLSRRNGGMIEVTNQSNP